MPSPTLPRHRVRSRPPLPAPAPPAEPDGEAAAPPGDADAARVASLEVEVAQLRAALTSRAAIEQAKGILMLLTGCTDLVAFELLSHISGHTHRKLRDVAQAITASASGGAGLPADIRTILRDVCPPSASRP